MAYIGNSPGVASQRVVTTFTATAGQTTFTPSSGYTLGYCDVFYNGVKLVNGDDYTASNGTSVVLTSAAAAGDSVEIVAHFPRGLTDGYLKSEADALLAAKQNSLGYTPVNKAGDSLSGVHRFNSYFAVGKGASNNDQITWNAIPDNLGNYTPHWAGSGDAGGVILGLPYGGGGGLELRVLRHGTSGSSKVLSDYPIRWAVDDSGRVTVPSQTSFRARRTTSFVLSTTNTSVITYDSVDHNYGGNYNSGNGRFTAPVAGTYLFRGHVQPTGSAYNVNIGFLKNGSALNYTQMGWVSLPGRSDIAVETIVALASGDYVEVAVAVGTAGQTFDNHGVFYGHLLA